MRGTLAKSDPLKAYLLGCRGNSCTITFDRIEDIIDRPLPRSAGKYREWWSDEPGAAAGHVQARSWMNAGWRVGSVRLDARQVRFVRNVQKP